MTTIDVNGCELFYAEAGAGPPVIFHHAYASTHHTWLAVVDLLASDYRCIALDARGVGGSARPSGGYDIDQMAVDVIGLADALGLAKFRFVGHSMGGIVGMELASRYPQRVEQLALVAPGPADGVPIPPALLEILNEQWRRGDSEALLRGRQGMIARERGLHGLADTVERSLAIADGHKFGCIDDLMASRRGPALSSIQTPTLMVAGGSDMFLTDNLKDYARLANASLHVFHRVGHSPPREVPEALAELLRDFFEHGVVSAEYLQRAAAKERIANGRS